jgi:hypothetical protein
MQDKLGFDDGRLSMQYVGELCEFLVVYLHGLRFAEVPGGRCPSGKVRDLQTSFNNLVQPFHLACLVLCNRVAVRFPQ